MITEKHPFIRFLTSPDKRGTDALLGFWLSSPPSKPRSNAGVQEHYLEALQRQIRIINSCWNSGIAALDLRFIGMKGATDILTGLLCRIACPPYLDSRQFHDFCLASARSVQQQATDIGYKLGPLSDDASLSRYIQPFAFQALGEIRRHEELFMLENAYTEFEIYVTQPWEWSIERPLALLDILRQRSGNWLISICLRSTQLSPEEWQLLQHATSSAMSDLLMGGGSKGRATYNLYQKFAQRLQQPYLLRIGLAASSQQTLGQIGKALLDEICTTLQSSAFPVLQVPQTANEWQRAEHNLLSLEWLPWSNLRDGVPSSARLRYLVDNQGASMIFHLPIAPEKKSSEQTMRVLLVFAEPYNAERQRLGTDDRLIHEAIERSRERDRFDITVRHAATVDTLCRALLENEFEIIHIAGHGAEDGIVLEDETGRAYILPSEKLADLFKDYYKEHKTLCCIVLSACSTISLGHFIVQGAQGVPFAIAMEGELGNKAARAFAKGFYDALGAGKDMPAAFNAGRHRADLAAIGSPFVAHLFRKN